MLTSADKLFERLAITDEGCWEFLGGRTGANYGMVSMGSRNLRGAHVLAYEYFNEPVPDGLQVLHKCDNPPCCNPDHLFVGTLQDNKDDEVAKGRHAYGERVGNHKLTEEDVHEIRELLSQGYSLASIGRAFDVTKQAIYWIREGKNWGWLND